MINPRSFYNVDYTMAGERLSPPFIRQPKYLAWIKSILTPLQQLRDNIFNTYYYDGGTDFTTGLTNFGLNERLKYNSQTILFEYYLNKKFNITSAPFIYIKNFVGGLDTVYLTDQNGDIPTYVGDSPNQVDTIFIANEDEYLPDNDFTVFVPTAVYTTLGASNPERDAVVQIEVDKYKIIGTKNNITAY